MGVDVVKQAGTLHSTSEVLKMSLNPVSGPFGFGLERFVNVNVDNASDSSQFFASFNLSSIFSI